jgi:hypothetical protein
MTQSNRLDKRTKKTIESISNNDLQSENLELKQKNTALEQRIADIQAQLERLRLSTDEAELLKKYRENKKIPLSAPYELKLLKPDRFRIKLEGRPNTLQFAWLKRLCFHFDSIEVDHLKYTDEKGSLHDIENPTDDQISAFKRLDYVEILKRKVIEHFEEIEILDNSGKFESVSGVNIMRIRDIEIGMKLKYPENESLPKEEYFNNFFNNFKNSCEDTLS